MTERETSDRAFILNTIVECPEAVAMALAAMDILPDTLSRELYRKALSFTRERLTIINDPERKKDMKHAEKVLIDRISEGEAEA